MTDRTMVRVLGMGNVLTGDDGLGPYVAQVLDARYVFPDGVEVIDVGTPGLDFAPYLDGARALIVVDTVSSKGEPGAIRTYRKDDLLARPMPDRMTPHQPGLREAMMAAELTDSTPYELLVVGVIPETTEAHPGLSDVVRGAVDEVVDVVLAELARLDCEPSTRFPPRQPDIWWEAP